MDIYGGTAILVIAEPVKRFGTSGGVNAGCGVLL